MASIADEKWLDDDGETWLVDPSRILTDTDRARLVGCAPELLNAAFEALATLHIIAPGDQRKMKALSMLERAIKKAGAE